jgi:aspartate-semialdehyde dehydrogenase
VGSETLLGREVREVFGQTELSEHLRLVAGAAEETGTLTEVGGSPAFLAKLEPDALEDAAVLILAGTPESSKAALEGNPTGLVIDLTYVTEEDPEGRVRAPMVESGTEAHDSRDHNGPQIVAHPAAIAIGAVLKRLNEAWPIQRAIVHIFEPASERGSAGIEELQQQTVSLLSFKPLEKATFDAQASFALLARLGSEAPVALETVEERIERHLASLLERLDGVPMPSLRLIQAPVFHGYSFSFWIEFWGESQAVPSASDIEDAMSQDPFDIRTADMEPPNNVGIAGQSGIAVGAVTPDRNAANAFWIWAAADNLRLSAENAAAIAAEVL